MDSITVEIYGKKYKFKGEDTLKIEEYAKFLNLILNDLDNKYNIPDASKLFLLAALNISEKYFELKEQNAKLSEDLENLHQQINLIDNIKF